VRVRFARSDATREMQSRCAARMVPALQRSGRACQRGINGVIWDAGVARMRGWSRELSRLSSSTSACSIQGGVFAVTPPRLSAPQAPHASLPAVGDVRPSNRRRASHDHGRHKDEQPRARGARGAQLPRHLQPGAGRLGRDVPQADCLLLRKGGPGAREARQRRCAGRAAARGGEREAATGRTGAGHGRLCAQLLQRRGGRLD
jgi:hypothetical protein